MKSSKNSKSLNLDGIKAEIKAELVQHDLAGFSLNLRKYISKRIAELGDSVEPEIIIRKIIYLNHLLFGYGRTGSLPQRELEASISLGRGIAQLATVLVPDAGAQLSRDFHYALSLVYRQQGLHDRAAWEQSRVRYQFSKGKDSPFEVLGSGLRLLRLGRIDLAMQQFNQCLDTEQNILNRGQAVIGLSKCLRLKSRFGDALRFARRHFDEFLSEPNIRLEIEWEIALSTAFEQKNFSILFELVKPGSPHRQPGYLIDCFFIKRIMPGCEDFALPRFSYMLRKKEMDFLIEGYYFRAAKSLEEFDDRGVAEEIRLNDIGESFASRSQLINIEQELLFLAALSRVLKDQNISHLAVIVLAAYENLSLCLSDGQSKDYFGLRENRHICAA